MQIRKLLNNRSLELARWHLENVMLVRVANVKSISRILVPWWVFKLIPFLENPMLMDRDNFFGNVTRSVIKQRKETGKRYNDFLQILMDCADESAQSVNQEAFEDETDRFGSIISNSALSSTAKYKKLSENEILAQCVLFFLVGYETTATVLTFLAYCLATNPEWQEKLIQEVDEAFEKHTEMSYDAVRDMKILDAVLSETLRTHSPLLNAERTAVEDYVLGDTGITVEKGMRINIPVYAMHYDPDFFQDPETFNPERFMDGYEPKHPQYAYLPFGAGPRNCLGMRFALLEIKMCITNILHHFRIKPLPTTEVPLDTKKSIFLLTVTELPLKYLALVKPWAPRVLPPSVSGLNGFDSTVMFSIYLPVVSRRMLGHPFPTESQTLQDALFICYKQSPDNTHSVSFSQRSISTRLIDDETFNDSNIINNLIDYEDRQEELDSLKVDENIKGSSFPTHWKSIFLK
ncbi:thromboxane-A synthase [Trichonephila clavipes]|uniref:Thromboxane-A synthase n=1 Tax=Trichonephila clavipes TaxID=2585209 RepID=A0A8X6W8M8_TRICX|nr:thromboxane-A synthase [Trichonephila clavipes]